MNKVILMGRLTRDPDVRYSNGAGYRSCQIYPCSEIAELQEEMASRPQILSDVVAFGRTAEFVEIFPSGMRMVISGRIQTGSAPIAMDRKCIPPTWLQKKSSLQRAKLPAMHFAITAEWVVDISRRHRLRRVPPGAAGDGFMNIPDGIDEELPFN